MNIPHLKATQGGGIFFIKYYSIHVYKNNNNLDKRKNKWLNPKRIILIAKLIGKYICGLPAYQEDKETGKYILTMFEKR